MPELPEAETICRQLNRVLGGGVIRGVELMRPEIVVGAGKKDLARLRGLAVGPVRRRGKMVTIRIGPDLLLVFHLRMTGSLVVRSERAAERHVHLIIRVRGRGGEDFHLHFRDPRRFGRVYLLQAHDASARPPLKDLGPDALRISREALALLMATPRRIKPLLLDQKRLAGLGNIYVDEILHRSLIHPLTPARSLSPRRVALLHRVIGRVLLRAIRTGGSSVRDYLDSSGRKGSFQKEHAVYRRQGQPCRSCSTPIVRATVGGRGTFWCPCCQPLSGRRRGGR